MLRGPDVILLPHRLGRARSLADRHQTASTTISADGIGLQPRDPPAPSRGSGSTLRVARRSLRYIGKRWIRAPARRLSDRKRVADISGLRRRLILLPRAKGRLTMLRRSRQPSFLTTSAPSVRIAGGLDRRRALTAYTPGILTLRIRTPTLPRGPRRDRVSRSLREQAAVRKTVDQGDISSCIGGSRSHLLIERRAFLDGSFHRFEETRPNVASPPSSRRFDDQGRMLVAVTVISKRSRISTLSSGARAHARVPQRPVAA